MLFEFGNKGQELLSTNCWESEPTHKGYCYLSLNAGAVRFLVPPVFEKNIKEMVNGVDFVIMTAGKMETHIGNQDAYEILFEDNSDSPYVIHIMASQSDRKFAQEDFNKKDFPFVIYTAAGKQNELRGHLRRAKKLPCLKAWNG